LAPRPRPVVGHLKEHHRMGCNHFAHASGDAVSPGGGGGRADRFGEDLEAEGYIARGGQIIEATIVSVPRQRKTKEEDAAIKAGKMLSMRFQFSSLVPK
jgi:hypothetical protein